jgi:hypothetical protein
MWLGHPSDWYKGENDTLTRKENLGIAGDSCFNLVAGRQELRGIVTL